MGLQCQTPLQDLKFTDTVVTWPLSYKFSLYAEKAQVRTVQLGKALDLKPGKDRIMFGEVVGWGGRLGW